MLLLRASGNVEGQNVLKTCFALQHDHLFASLGYKSGLHIVMGIGGASSVVTDLGAHYEVSVASKNKNNAKTKYVNDRSYAAFLPKEETQDEEEGANALVRPT